MRVGVAGLWHETNTYSAQPTSLTAFQKFELLHSAEVFLHHRGKQTVIGGFLKAADFELVPILSAGAWPGGVVTESAFTDILDLLEDQLARLPRLDGVLLNLHGAMVAEDTEDAETVFARRIRAHAGDIPIAAVLDLHGNVSPELASVCDVLIAYDTYPHVDMAERGAEAAKLITELLGGRRLRTSIAKIPLLSPSLAQATDASPMRDLFEISARAARMPGIRRISLLPGFPYSDIARAGFSILVVADTANDSSARAVAGELAVEVESRRAQFSLHRDDATRAVTRAISSTATPVVLVDVADNVGGGAPGDGTAILSELLSQRAKGAVVQLADPEVVRTAHLAGVGSELTTAVGAKTDLLHGKPVTLRARVVRLEKESRYLARGSYMTGVEFSMGSTAVLDSDGVTIVVTEFPIPPFHREQLETVGVDPASASIIVAKGAIAWRSAFGDLAKTVIEVDTPGICPIDTSLLPRKTAPMRIGMRLADSMH